MQLLEQIAAGDGPQLMPLSVEQYAQMASAGILQEGAPVELIDGFVVWKDRRDAERPEMNHGPDHALAIKLLVRELSAQLAGRDCHVQCQLPIAIPPKSVPEPDVSVLRGEPEDYRGRLPEAGDVLLVVEVAASSLRFDRITKRDA